MSNNNKQMVWDWGGDILIKQYSYTPAQSRPLTIDCTITRCIVKRDVKYGKLSSNTVQQLKPYRYMGI